MQKKVKQKTCRVCKEKFLPSNSLQVVCSPLCAIKLVDINKEKKKNKAHRESKAEFDSRDRPFQLKLAQTAFNAFIRERDKDLPCISCGRHHKGQYHAGHYRSVGAAQHLRFNQFNVHKQCAPCNNHKSGNITEYRINLCKKIGPYKVEWLECQNDINKFSLPNIIAIKLYYRKMLNRLKKC